MVGTVLVVKKSGGLAADSNARCVGCIHWDGWMLSDMRWCVKIIIIIILYIELEMKSHAVG